MRRISAPMAGMTKQPNTLTRGMSKRRGDDAMVQFEGLTTEENDKLETELAKEYGVLVSGSGDVICKSFLRGVDVECHRQGCTAHRL